MEYTLEQQWQALIMGDRLEEAHGSLQRRIAELFLPDDTLEEGEELGRRLQALLPKGDAIQRRLEAEIRSRKKTLPRG